MELVPERNVKELKLKLSFCNILFSNHSLLRLTDIVFKTNGNIFILTFFHLGRKSLLKLSKKYGFDYGKI